MHKWLVGTVCQNFSYLHSMYIELSFFIYVNNMDQQEEQCFLLRVTVLGTGPSTLSSISRLNNSYPLFLLSGSAIPLIQKIPLTLHANGSRKTTGFSEGCFPTYAAAASHSAPRNSIQCSPIYGHV